MATAPSNNQPIIQILNQEENQPSISILNNVMTETIGMALHNAVTAQHNAQMSNNATTTATVSRILGALHYPSAKKAIPTEDSKGPSHEEEEPDVESPTPKANKWPEKGF